MLELFIFGTFAGLLLFSSVMVVFARQTMQAILWLVLAFVSAAALWVLLHAEFLGLLLVLVYVGAVLTLFLFVIMTLSNQPPVHSLHGSNFYQYALALSLVLLGLGCILYGLYDQITLPATQAFINPSAQPSYQEANTKALGIRLYNDFVYPFELAGILLLVAIIVSISLHSGSHIPNPYDEQKKRFQKDQIQVKREDRIKLVRGEE